MLEVRQWDVSQPGDQLNGDLSSTPVQPWHHHHNNHHHRQHDHDGLSWEGIQGLQPQVESNIPLSDVAALPQLPDLAIAWASPMTAPALGPQLDLQLYDQLDQVVPFCAAYHPASSCFWGSHRPQMRLHRDWLLKFMHDISKW